MRDIVLISYTTLDASGGVPRWNRDFVQGFTGTRHYSWDDVQWKGSWQDPNVSEWDRASCLGAWLHGRRLVNKEDIIITDGFWGEWLSSAGYNVISVAHGIWSHLTKEDVLAGKQPEFPAHHAVQKKHRKDHLTRGGKIVAVSDFIADQMKEQWGFDSTVINNAIDLERFKPPLSRTPLERPLVIHGVTTHNKGFDHIAAFQHAVDGIADVMLLDDAAKKYKMDKYDILGHASLVVQPSAYEGNSYFVLETLACDVPIVAYNVGLLYSISKICKCDGDECCCIGSIIDRKFRSPEETAKVGKFILESVLRDRTPYEPRKAASHFSIGRFHSEWKSYLENYERNIKSR